VLGRIYGTGQREAELYVTGILRLDLIVLGRIEKLWEVLRNVYVFVRKNLINFYFDTEGQINFRN